MPHGQLVSAPADMKARSVQTRFIFSSSAKHTRGGGRLGRGWMKFSVKGS